MLHTSSAISHAWVHELEAKLPLLGHRNWIVIADSAYPLQSSAGIQTILADQAQEEVIHKVLSTLSHSRHVRPVMYLDKELDFVAEGDAPGVTKYRQTLNELLASQPVSKLPHEEIIVKLDQAASLFSILLIKTPMTIPYTTLFLQLDCKYWSEEAEKRLRAALK